jgi:hypothetical protein
MSKFNTLCNQILSESHTVSTFPVGEVFHAKGVGEGVRVSEDQIRWLSGKEQTIKSLKDKDKDRPASPAKDLSRHDFDLFVELRTGKINKDEFNDRLQNKDHSR